MQTDELYFLCFVFILFMLKTFFMQLLNITMTKNGNVLNILQINDINSDILLMNGDILNI